MKKRFLIALRARHKSCTTSQKAKNLSFTPKFSTAKTTKHKPLKPCHTDLFFVILSLWRSIHKFKVQSCALKAWIFRFLAKAQNDKMVWDFSLAKLTQNDNALVILSDSEVSIQKNGEWIAEFMDFSLRSK